LPKVDSRAHGQVLSFNRRTSNVRQQGCAGPSKTRDRDEFGHQRATSRYWTAPANREIVPLVLAAPPFDATTRRILVADDEPAIRMLLRFFLERRGYDVIEASSAAEIFRILETERPDVLLLDIHLGSEDGLAIGAGLRQERQYSSLTIVFMSGVTDQVEIGRLSRQWNLPILVKPFDFDALLRAIDPSRAGADGEELG
jgi:CheY-like chemotaxis protein